MTNDIKRESDKSEAMSNEQLEPSVTDNPLPAAAQTRIAQQLRAAYGELLAEPLPGKFASLLDQLAKPKPEENQ